MHSYSSWIPEFSGRITILEEIDSSWKRIVEDPTSCTPEFVMLLGENGTGKTRLIQEFYHRISTTLDPNNYWPDRLGINGKNLQITPDFSSHIIRRDIHASNPKIPWIWFPIRFHSRSARNSLETESALFHGMQALVPHLTMTMLQAGLINIGKDALRELYSNLEENTLDLISEDLASVIPLGRFLVSVIRKGKSLYDNSKKTLYEIQQEENANIEIELLNALRKLFNRKPPVPVILAIDDIQELKENGSAAAFLELLYKEAIVNSWPLLVIATVNSINWRCDSANDNKSPSIAKQLYSNTVSISPHEYDLDNDEFKLTEENMGRIIDDHGCKLDAEQRTKLIDRADGNPLVLVELLYKIRSDSDGSVKEKNFRRIMGNSTSLHQIILERVDNLSNKHLEILESASYQGPSFSVPILYEALNNLWKDELSSVSSLVSNLQRIHVESALISKPNDAITEFLHRTCWEVLKQSRESSGEDISDAYKKLLDHYLNEDNLITVDRRTLEDLYNLGLRLERDEGKRRKVKGKLVTLLAEQGRYADALPIAATIINEINNNDLNNGKGENGYDFYQMLAVIRTLSARGFDIYDLELDDTEANRVLYGKQDDGFLFVITSIIDGPLRGLAQNDTDILTLETVAANFYRAIGIFEWEYRHLERVAKWWQKYLTDHQYIGEILYEEYSEGLRANAEYANLACRYFREPEKATKEEVEEHFFDIAEWIEKTCKKSICTGGKWRLLGLAYMRLATALVYTYGPLWWGLWGEEIARRLQDESKRRMADNADYLTDLLTESNEITNDIVWPVIYSATLIIEYFIANQLTPLSERFLFAITDAVLHYLEKDTSPTKDELVAILDFSIALEAYVRLQEYTVITDRIGAIRKAVSKVAVDYGEYYQLIVQRTRISIITAEGMQNPEEQVAFIRSSVTDAIRSFVVSREAERLEYGEIVDLLPWITKLIELLPHDHKHDMVNDLVNGYNGYSREKLLKLLFRINPKLVSSFHGLDS